MVCCASLLRFVSPCRKWVLYIVYMVPRFVFRCKLLLLASLCYFCLKWCYSSSNMTLYIRSFRDGFGRPLLLFLLLLSCFFLFVTVSDFFGDQGFVSAQGSGSGGTVGKGWAVKSFIWNEDVNIWARTNCTLSIGGTGPLVSGESSQSACDNTSANASLSFVQYYHDVDPDDTTPNDSTDDVYGKFKGRAWSPLYGVIYFDPSDFPSSGNNASCYGLGGNNRQARIRRSGGEVQLIGCAYVPLLRDYILFNKSGATGSGVPSSGWDGVFVVPIETPASAYLTLYGCAWSSKSGFWSFGPNQISLSSSENCLPSGHNTNLKKALPESQVGSPGTVLITINPTHGSAKIGQEIGYQYSCPDGYATPSLRIGSRIVSAVLSLFRGFYREIFTDPVSTIQLTCTDRSGIFLTPRRSAGAVSTSVQNTFFISSFTVIPSVLTEGGFVSFGGKVSNQGGFSQRAVVDNTIGHCDNTVLNKCIHGTANAAAIPDDSSYYKWRCDGVGGVHSAPCQIPITVPAPTEKKLNASDKASYDFFGSAVSLSGDVLVIGATQEDPGVTDAGTVYIYTDHDKDGDWTDTGTIEKKLNASDKAGSDLFGSAVSLSGNVLVIGATQEDPGGIDAGTVYIYTDHDKDGDWTDTGTIEKKLNASDKVGSDYDYFGSAVSLSGDVLVVGAEREDPPGKTDAGTVYIYTDHDKDGDWTDTGTIEKKLNASDKAGGDYFGSAVSLSGDVLIVGAEREHPGGTNDAGTVYIYTDHDKDGDWTDTGTIEKKLNASDKAGQDYFGSAVSLSGSVLIVGAEREHPGGTNDAGTVYIYTDHDKDGDWTDTGTIEKKLNASDKAGQDYFGSAVSLSGNILTVGATAEDPGFTNAGTVYVYTFPITGECDNTVRNGCIAGTKNDVAVVDTVTHYRWQCDGTGGGGDSGACQFSKAAIPGNEGYCTITNKITKKEVYRFNVDGVNVSIGGSDIATQDTVYELQCQYKKFAADGSFDKWQSVAASPIAVKVLPRDVSERNVSAAGVVATPTFSESGGVVKVTIPSDAAMTYVYRLDAASAKHIGPSTLYKIFVDRDAVELSDDETVDELKGRLFASTTRGKVVVVSSSSGSITQSAVSGKTLVAVARAVGGSLSQQVSYIPSATGVCGATRNSCVIGAANDGAVEDTKTHYKWRCDGVSGGANSSVCEFAKAVTGFCDNTVRNACVAGKVNDGAVADTNTYYRWRCDGSGGGANSGTCQIAIAGVIAGSCKNAVRNGCSAGTARYTGSDANDTTVPVAYRDTATAYKWRCDGINGGDNSTACSINKASVIAGSCKNAVRNKCTAGTVNDGAVTDTATHYRWRCDSTNGGENSDVCKIAKTVTCTNQTSPKLVTATGSFSFSVPCNIYSIAVELVGAGGKGGDGGNSGSWGGKSGSAGSNTTFGTLTAKGGGGGGGGGYASGGGSGSVTGGGGGGGSGGGGSGAGGGGSGGGAGSSGSSGTGDGGGGGGGKGGSGGSGQGKGGAGSSSYGLGGGGGSGRASASGGDVNTHGGTAAGASYSQSKGGDGDSGSKSVSGLSGYGKGRGGSSGPFSGQYAGGGGGGGGAYVKKNAYTVTPGQTISGSVGVAGGSGAQNGAARISWTPAPIPGSCNNAVQHACSVGSFEDYTDSSTHYRWRCLGLNSGAKSGVCSVYKSSVTVGSCNNTVRNGCTAGTPDSGAVNDTSTHYKWVCAGADGGIDSGTCSTIKPAIIGSCNNSVRNRCSAGTARYTGNDASDTTVPVAYRDTATAYKWRCDGARGGANSGVCSILKSLVIAGSCATLTVGTTPTSANACTAGSYNDGAISDTDTHYKYRCDGSGGGVNSSACSVGKIFNLAGTGNNAPRGIWSNGTTMWVVDSGGDKIYAYSMSTKARDASKDFNTLSAAGNNNPYGLWSNGTTMWVVDISDRKIYAYNLTTKARDSSKDFTTLQSAGNTSPRGLWSNGTTMWVSDWSKKIYAYNMSTKARDTSKEFSSLDAQNTKPREIWSNGTTMWVADYGRNKLFAYTLSSRTRNSSKDVAVTGGTSPHGMWSDGTWVWASVHPKKLVLFGL